MPSADGAPGFGQAASSALEGDHASLHRKMLTERLGGMFNVKELSDTTFIVDQDTIYASRLVLAAASDYFKAMLIGEGFKETAPGTPIEIHGVDKPSFVICLQYLYSGTAELTRENVVAVLHAADMFRIDTLCAACAQAMLAMVDAATCLRFLSAVDGLPNLGESVRRACLNVVEHSPGEVFSGDVVSDAKSLSLGTMLDVCASVGRGLRNSPTPPTCLQQVMDIVLAWAQLYFQCPDLTQQGLCERVENELLLPPGQQLEQQVHESTCAFSLTKAQISKNTEHNSRAMDMAGYDFQVHLRTNDGESSHFGVYLCPLAHSAYPRWWPCILRAQLHGSPGGGCQFLGVFWKLFDTFRFFESGQGYVFGLPTFGPHSSLPDAPIAGGKLSGQDVRVNLALTVKVVFNSLSSLCVAHAFFHPDLWSTLPHGMLRGMVHLDEAPFESEDALLATLLSLNLDVASVHELLRHVRWQFLSPAFLLEACRRSDAGPLRSCAATRDALKWLLGEGEKPKEACERRRTAYTPSVRDCRRAEKAELIEWLLGDPCELDSERAVALEERVRVAEARAQAAEERARKAEAGIREWDV